ncbi:MAG TPA: hypothetical protein VHP81_11005 [Lachnospiraceae bacterium]|nr:hypothetical protein [Lachnospiraceae bacterium]
MRKKLITTIIALLILTTIVDVSKVGMEVMAASEEEISTILMGRPTFRYFMSDKVIDVGNDSLELKLKSSKTNKITDDEEWFSRNKLTINIYDVPSPANHYTGNLPDGLDLYWGDLVITSAFYDTSYIYCTYGADYSQGYILNIYDVKTLDLVYSLDFSNYRYSPKYIEEDYDYIEQQIKWATVKDNILYISHSHWTYAKSSKNMNAYITAIDLTDMSILWRTKALVSNAYNFIVIDDVIFSGYGFTNERDYLYQIDMNTGKILDKTLLKSSVSYIVKKGNALYVRTYNTDYKFDIVQ